MTNVIGFSTVFLFDRREGLFFFFKRKFRKFVWQ